jgi:hypothetical protein
MELIQPTMGNFVTMEQFACESLDNVFGGGYEIATRSFDKFVKLPAKTSHPIGEKRARSVKAPMMKTNWAIKSQITIVDVQTGQPVRPPLEAPGWVWGITFDKTGRKLVVADGVTDEKLPQQSGSAHVVDWMTGEFLRSVRVKDPRCRRATLTPSGDILIAASERTLSSWDVASGRLLAEDRIADGRNFVHLIEAKLRPASI